MQGSILFETVPDDESVSNKTHIYHKSLKLIKDTSLFSPPFFTALFSPPFFTALFPCWERIINIVKDYITNVTY